MAECILVKAGGGTGSDDCSAVKANVLAGVTAVTKDSGDEAVAGTMANKGAWTSRIGVNGKAVIPAGYHNGSGYVDQTITNRGAVNAALGINGTYTIPEGYHNGSGKVTQSIATMGAQTVTPGTNTTTVYCSGKYMTGNIVVQGYGEAYGIISASAARGQAKVHTYSLPGLYVMFDDLRITHYGTFGVTKDIKLSSWLKAGQEKNFDKFKAHYDGSVLTITGKSDLMNPGGDPILENITIDSGVILCCRRK